MNLKKQRNCRTKNSLEKPGRFKPFAIRLSVLFRLLPDHFKKFVPDKFSRMDRNLPSGTASHFHEIEEREAKQFARRSLWKASP